MNKDFAHINLLIEEVKRDKTSEGANSSILNRYPIRFILFDNFTDSKEFVNELIELGVTKMQKIVDWMDKKYPDQMLTHTYLADCIKQYITDNSNSDCIIVPFSELARFYNNRTAKEFDALVSDIKGTQATAAGFNHHQRIYIPMIGQYGKMSKFFADTQSVIWHLVSSKQDVGYHMILTRSTYQVKGLEREFTIVPSITDWLKVWRDDEVKSDIISTSHSIYAFADNALPDNALSYTVCNNAYEFLTKGLHLDFGEISNYKEDAGNWEKLAREIEYKNFSFEKFFNKYFDIFDLSDYSVFIKAWFENSEDFKRWLLTTYYTKRFCNNGYICRLLRECHSYSNQELISTAALYIFDIEHPEEYLDERAEILNYAKKNKIQLTDDVEDKLSRKIENLSIEKGYETALRYVTRLSMSEKKLLINWIADGHVAVNRLVELYPELYSYMEKSCGISNTQLQWVLDYMDAYKQAKLVNKYTDSVKKILDERNANNVTFSSWYNQFRTIRTELSGRKDIEVFYWIDGLGIDWIPFIIQLVEKYKSEGVFVNDVMVAHSLLPSKTENNKADLSKLTNDNLSKKGDLDSFAHKCTPYPQYIIEEMKIVETAVKEIISEHAGKKIAIVSDHGLSYLSQIRPGYNIGGIKSDHYGRCAIRTIGAITQDNRYITLDDEQTICSLRHESLAAKIANGQGCHGGCTPEEVLVPIIILSSQRQSSEYTLSLVDNEIAGNFPTVIFRIKGVTSMEIPKLIYNNIGYNLNNRGNYRFESDRLDLKQDVNEVEVRIGSYSQKFKIKINLGAEEEDLFDL
ncbi:MAG: BREX-4 system phosphatase PglZ [Prevotellaceae bacterium]|jgi:hypothetical protein|nr:BREX-4 system phosphatase PglZ [Prevotellaceae bacterium]